MAEQTPHYLGATANAARTTQAWKYASFVLGAVVVLLAHALISQARNAPVVLVPFELATSTGKMNVSVNGEMRGTSSEYLANLGLSDLTLILNFIPDNVISQHQRFLNRLTDELFGQQRENLLAQAEDYKNRSITQSFYTSGIKVSADSTKVEISGTQVRWVGGKDIRTNVTYVLTYKSFKGFMHVSDLRQETDVKK
jgi:type IV conjugative transfer system protein TraE